MDKFAINWQNFAKVGLQLKFAFRIWPLTFKNIRVQYESKHCYILLYSTTSTFSSTHSITDAIFAIKG